MMKRNWNEMRVEVLYHFEWETTQLCSYIWTLDPHLVVVFGLSCKFRDVKPCWKKYTSEDGFWDFMYPLTSSLLSVLPFCGEEVISEPPVPAAWYQTFLAILDLLSETLGQNKNLYFLNCPWSQFFSQQWQSNWQEYHQNLNMFGEFGLEL